MAIVGASDQRKAVDHFGKQFCFIIQSFPSAEVKKLRTSAESWVWNFYMGKKGALAEINVLSPIKQESWQLILASLPNLNLKVKKNKTKPRTWRSNLKLGPSMEEAGPFCQHCWHKALICDICFAKIINHRLLEPLDTFNTTTPMDYVTKKSNVCLVLTGSFHSGLWKL